MPPRRRTRAGNKVKPPSQRSSSSEDPLAMSPIRPRKKVRSEADILLESRLDDEVGLGGEDLVAPSDEEEYLQWVKNRNERLDRERVNQHVGGKGKGVRKEQEVMVWELEGTPSPRNIWLDLIRSPSPRLEKLQYHSRSPKRVKKNSPSGSDTRSGRRSDVAVRDESQNVECSSSKSIPDNGTNEEGEDEGESSLATSMTEPLPASYMDEDESFDDEVDEDELEKDELGADSEAGLQVMEDLNSVDQVRSPGRIYDGYNGTNLPSANSFQDGKPDKSPTATVYDQQDIDGGSHWKDIQNDDKVDRPFQMDIVHPFQMEIDYPVGTQSPPPSFNYHQPDEPPEPEAQPLGTPIHKPTQEDIESDEDDLSHPSPLSTHEEIRMIVPPPEKPGAMMEDDLQRHSPFLVNAAIRNEPEIRDAQHELEGIPLAESSQGALRRMRSLQSSVISDHPASPPRLSNEVTAWPSQPTHHQSPLRSKPPSPVSTFSQVAQRSNSVVHHPSPNHDPSPSPHSPQAPIDPALAQFRTARTFRTRTTLQLQPYTRERQVYEAQLRRGGLKKGRNAIAPAPEIPKSSEESEDPEVDQQSSSSSVGEVDGERVIIAPSPERIRRVRKLVEVIDADYDEYFLEHGKVADEEDEQAMRSLQRIARRRLGEEKKERRRRRDEERSRREFEELIKGKESSPNHSANRPIRRDQDKDKHDSRNPARGIVKYTDKRPSRKPPPQPDISEDDSLPSLPPSLPPLRQTREFTSPSPELVTSIRTPLDHQMDVDIEPMGMFEADPQQSFYIDDLPTNTKQRRIPTPTSVTSGETSDSDSPGVDRRAKIARRMMPAAMLKRLEREAAEKERQKARREAKKRIVQISPASPVRPGHAVIRRGQGDVDMSGLLGMLASPDSSSPQRPNSNERTSAVQSRDKDVVVISSDDDSDFGSQAEEDNGGGLVRLYKGDFESLVTGMPPRDEMHHKKRRRHDGKRKERRPALGIAKRVAQYPVSSTGRMVQTRLDFPIEDVRSPSKTKYVTPRHTSKHGTKTMTGARRGRGGKEKINRPAIQLNDRNIWATNDFAFDDSPDLPRSEPKPNKTPHGHHQVQHDKVQPRSFKTDLNIASKKGKGSKDAAKRTFQRTTSKTSVVSMVSVTSSIGDVDHGIGKARSWANFESFPIDFSISPLPSGLFCSEDSILTTGRVDSLIRLLSKSNHNSMINIESCETYGISLDPNMGEDSLSPVIPLLFDKIYSELILYVNEDISIFPDFEGLSFIGRYFSLRSSMTLKTLIRQKVLEISERLDDMLSSRKHSKSAKNTVLGMRWELFELSCRLMKFDGDMKVVEIIAVAMLTQMLGGGFDKAVKPLKRILRGEVESPEIMEVSTIMWIAIILVLSVCSTCRPTVNPNDINHRDVNYPTNNYPTNNHHTVSHPDHIDNTSFVKTEELGRTTTIVELGNKAPQEEPTKQANGQEEMSSKQTGDDFFLSYLLTAFQTAFHLDHSGPLAAERIWFLIFSLCAFSQFDTFGRTTSQYNPIPRWPLVRRAISLIRISHNEETEERSHADQLYGRDRYIQIILSRCIRLSSKWKWSLNQENFNLATRDLGKIFKERQYRNLPSEPFVDFPKWITSFDVSLTSSESENDQKEIETAFEMFLKFVCVSASDLISSTKTLKEALKVEKDLQRLIMTIIPVSPVKFNKLLPPNKKQLGQLINRYSTMVAGCYFSPGLVGWLLANSRKWQLFKEADFDSRRVTIRGIMYVGVALRHHEADLSLVMNRFEEMLNVLQEELDQIKRLEGKKEQSINRQNNHFNMFEVFPITNDKNGNTTVNTMNEKFVRLPEKEEVERTMILIVASIKQIILHDTYISGQPSITDLHITIEPNYDHLNLNPAIDRINPEIGHGKKTKYPPPCLLHSSWTSKVFNLELDKKCQEEIINVIQTYLNIRQLALPDKAKKMREEKLESLQSESFDEFGSLGIDWSVEPLGLGGGLVDPLGPEMDDGEEGRLKEMNEKEKTEKKVELMDKEFADVSFC
ncbi:hypothetical protein TREMEDRAFT_64332 [Tremella mesenterica DSM 1558]|uniref:uncharacterized protein n=1 Tax=Tremella mesenterica (strain ATCC 24925 / CBS 8224 / DSM 1558 / NBRC 9311 / NRRL Y-6157 / RJB 2259-6 / UBC 559-6) TaxID=578456 RepID=UPI0003F48CE8|nr:uncharacterized protein TREMEDRAFT_64332 [Tremella mesenterica DSM 1558]EIW67740.1 hypothetical protein TREMEDRAFT_64332 [Tremella mesenterica DSM 1558]